ncbi:hydroxyacylglutathione hydrolase [Thalassovita autumnalis]|uniref:Hydroxyacylglutathione hydrolase n=1 Tax=Thalassovita autumnalis TaxID=2072972 RepID=A0A0P1G2R3_9RHOB|nr:MBL fold metallo-hydrolase [Thalassovita autumnalis]CUH67567.1 hydroxyacylglutathione hydrolase [Thalassovita autumnalis]CUH73943.1 hydroxyacylglutathione hydrolase [Thalassovita autumnalis]
MSLDTKSERAALNGLRYPFEAPENGSALEVAEGVLWIRMPLPMALDHVNIYALDEGDHWTIVDAGVYSKRSVAIWENLLAGALGGKPVGRVILTHHHPDHVGAVGWFRDRFDAELLTTRTAFLTARMLILDEEAEPTKQAIAYWRSAGMSEEVMQKRLNERPFNFADISHPLPVGYTRVRQGDVIRAGGRDWDVHIGNGHAPEHLTLWSRDDNLVISGDQILPSISPNIGVHPTEPEADPLGEWLESCLRLQPLAREDHLVLGGHKTPFTGLPLRMHQLIENHHGGLRRLLQHLEKPRTAVECFPPLFKRSIDGGTYGLAMVEAVAHLNHLHHTGEVTRERRADGAWLWQRKAP